MNDEARVKALLDTADGQALLRYLQYRYDGDNLFVAESPEATAYRLGMREVYRELKYLSERGKPDG